MVTELLSSNCGAHLVESYKQTIQTGWDISFHHIWRKSGWVYHLANLHILKTWISLEQRDKQEIFEKSKQHFSSHAVYLFMFENGLDCKDAIFRHSTTLRKTGFHIFLVTSDKWTTVNMDSWGKCKIFKCDIIMMCSYQQLKLINQVWNLQCNGLKVYLHLLSTKYQPGIKKRKQDNCLHQVQAMLLAYILLWGCQA